ncbi:MAG: D-alanyl-D-alanine carboxypeptidase, partial [Pseudomonadota bacterium]
MKSIKYKILSGVCGLVCTASVFSATAQIIPAPPQVNAKGY